MSDRHYDHRGSSRSSRHYSDRDHHHRSRERSRSRERDRREFDKEKQRRDFDKERERRKNELLSKSQSTKESPPQIDPLEVQEDVPQPPPPPRISKVTMGFNKPTPKPAAPIKLSLSSSSASTAKAASAPQLPKRSVASVFSTDDDDEPEEMPAEARMRMRNIGRETPTSAGPNSFGKTKHGFCDLNKLNERNLKAQIEQASGDTPKVSPRFPQTIYKLTGNNHS